MKRVLFYFFKNVHAPVMLPVYYELKKDPNLEIGFCSPFEGYVRELRAGFKDGEQSILPVSEVQNVRMPQEFKSDVVFIADAVTHMVQNCGKIINIGHGLLSKGQYFTNTGFTHRENLQHLLLVPGELHKQQLKDSKSVFIPVEAVGYPKLDGLFKPDVLDRDELFRVNNLDPSKKLILFAPTFNIALSSIPILWTRIKELATPDTYLMIKLHGSTIPELTSGYMQIAAENPNNILFVGDLDITPCLALADVMLSDVSSAFMEFALLDKPVVLFNNPNQAEYVNYDPNDIEYKWRDIGIQVNSLEGVKRAINKSLEHPEQLSERRQYYINKLGINLDGRASERVAQMMWELLDGNIEKRLLHPKEKVAVVLSGNNAGSHQIASTVNTIIDNCGERVSLFMSDNGLSYDDKSNLIIQTNNLLKILPVNEIAAALETMDYFCLAPVGLKCEERWLFRLLNHLRKAPEINTVVPLTPNGSPEQDPLKLLDNPDSNQRNSSMLDANFKSALVGRNQKLTASPRSDLGVIRLSSISKSELMGILNGKVVNPLTDAHLVYDVIIPVSSIAGRDKANFVESATDKRIKELVQKIESVIPKGIETQSENRKEAEAHLRLARHHQGRGNTAKALSAAEKAIKAYPDCLAAHHIIRQIQQIRQSEFSGSNR
jgi:hypothetical protein